MSKDEIIEFASNNNIKEDTQLVLTILENDNPVIYNGRFSFRFNGNLAITEDKVGIRIQKIKDAVDMPYVGGLLFKNLINIQIND